MVLANTLWTIAVADSTDYFSAFFHLGLMIGTAIALAGAAVFVGLAVKELNSTDSAGQGCMNQCQPDASWLLGDLTALLASLIAAAASVAVCLLDPPVVTVLGIGALGSILAAGGSMAHATIVLGSMAGCRNSTGQSTLVTTAQVGGTIAAISCFAPAVTAVVVVIAEAASG